MLDQGVWTRCASCEEDEAAARAGAVLALDSHMALLRAKHVEVVQGDPDGKKCDCCCYCRPKYYFIAQELRRECPKCNVCKKQRFCHACNDWHEPDMFRAGHDKCKNCQLFRCSQCPADEDMKPRAAFDPQYIN